jgi:hypothetical protein
MQDAAQLFIDDTKTGCSIGSVGLHRLLRRLESLVRGPLHVSRRLRWTTLSESRVSLPIWKVTSSM